MSERSNRFEELKQALQAALTDLADGLRDLQVEAEAVFNRMNELRSAEEDAEPSYKTKDEILKRIGELSEAQEHVKRVFNRVKELRSGLQASADEIIGLDLSSSGEGEED